MSHLAINCSKTLAVAFLLISSSSLALGQESSVIKPGSHMVSLRAGTLTASESPVSGDPATILAGFVAAETKGREALNQHTFKRDVVLQTIGPNGEVTGEYIRNSQFVFDDRGRRIERVLFHPASTIREMRITKEDIQDLADSQLLGIDIVEATKYRLTYAGSEVIDSRQLFAIDVTPLTAPDPNRMRERYFVGRVWVDPVSFQLVKIKGLVEPQGKQRFPVFETWREPVKGPLAFPTRTEADDILHFRDRDVHYRIKVRYYDYQLFASKVSVTEVDDAPPKISEASPSSLPLPKIQPPRKAEVCSLNRNAPPVGYYHWPADADVKVYFVRNMFTPEQEGALLEAMKTWTTASLEIGSGVKFTYAGEAEGFENCQSCLTVTRREVQKYDKHHYAFFNPMSQGPNRQLISAWIDFDIGITKPKALQGFMTHEMGHGMGLWDCETCKKKGTIMNGFPGINKDNGLSAPSACDLATTKDIYQQARQVSAVGSFSARRELLQPSSPFAPTPVGLNTATSSFLFDLQAHQDPRALPWWGIF